MHIPQASSLDQNNVTLCLTFSNIFFEKLRTSGSTTPQNQPPYPFLHVRDNKRRPQACIHELALLTFPSSCLDGGVTRVGPGRNPQYNRAWLAREVVGCSQNNHHKAQPQQPMSPTTFLTRRCPRKNKKVKRVKKMYKKKNQPWGSKCGECGGDRSCYSYFLCDTKLAKCSLRLRSSSFTESSNVHGRTKYKKYFCEKKIRQKKSALFVFLESTAVRDSLNVAGPQDIIFS